MLLLVEFFFPYVKKKTVFGINIVRIVNTSIDCFQKVTLCVFIIFMKNNITLYKKVNVEKITSQKMKKH
jgi:hypothetical protein